MRTTYKKPLTVSEQVEHIKNNKNVVFDNISEEDAELLLYEHNYINLVTPYKHRFAQKRKDGTTIRDNFHNHIYPRPVHFDEYYLSYLEERTSYPIIYSNIMRFESLFNAVVSYEMIHYYRIFDYQAFLDFIQSLSINTLALSTNKTYSMGQIDNMRKEIYSFEKTMEKYEDIYIFMDRLSLSETITVFRCSAPKLKGDIFKTLLNINGTIGYKTFSTFDEALTRLVPIRNCICHSNSLEVLTMYLRIKQKQLRTSTDRNKYKSLISKLSLE